MDAPVIAALVTASAILSTAALTHVTKLISDLRERRRHNRIRLMAIRNELIVNKALVESILAYSRTYGIRLRDNVWTTSDTSVIFLHDLPAEKILEVYTTIQLFNTLNERYRLIAQSPDYGPTKGQRLAQEQQEMVELARKIEKTTSEVLEELTL